MFEARWLRRGGHVIRSGRGGSAILLFGTLFTLAVCTRIEGLGNRRATVVMASDAFAQSALTTLVGDLQTEIAQGSTATTTGGGTIYQPLSPLYMLPARSGNPAPSGSPAVDPIPNLIRRSVRADAIATPGISSLASAINSSADPSLNGSAINAARWNLHYLVPRFDAGSTADSTPDAAAQFTTPDWVLVTRNGPSVQTGIGTGATALNNADPANTNYVVGRYAFAMYDEGGLLDVNAAGHPTPASPASPTGFTATQVGLKGLSALADLTQLPLAKNPASVDPAADPSEYLTQASIDNIVGWRNYASAQPAGTFPNYTFNATAATRWYDSVLTNHTGFLSVDPTVQFNGQTDQLFTSRQQLIGLCDSFGLSRNALQYLTTFSRALEQPSLVPAHIQFPANSSTGLQEAPNINAVSAMIPPPASSANSYQGNNDQAGMSTNGTQSAQDVVNAAFLTVRVPATVPGGRNDGSDLVQGEPLVKKRFSLRRLSWITYKGPSANNLTDPNVQQAITAMGGDPTNANDPIYQLVAQGTAANIQKYFGLTWGPDPTWGGYVWTYNHGANSILTLAQVAAAGREVDFAELLKAAINVGSLAKGGPNLNYFSGTVFNYQYTLDTTVDFNVLQITANLIDQFDTDSYPTVIELAVPGSRPRAFRGVEDLPYFYRFHPFSVVKTLPSPLLSRSNTVAFKSNSATVTATNTAPASSLTLSNPGEAELLWAADVWNPHDANTPKGATGSRPAKFRLSAVTDDPLSATPPWQVVVSGNVNGAYYGTVPPQASIPSSTTTLTDASTSFTFSDAAGSIFREPTLLWRTDAPTGANITPDAGSLAGPYVDANTSTSYCGVWVGKTPLAFVAPVSGYSATPSDSNNRYLFEEAGQLQEVEQVPAGSYRQYTFRLWYQDPTSGHWVIYDENYPDLHGLYGPNIILDKADYSNLQYLNSWATAQISDDARGYDPRSGRFGMGISGGISASGLALLETAAATNYKINTTAANTATGNSKYTVLTTTRPAGDRGNQTNYAGPCQTSDPGNMLGMRWYSGMGWNAAGNAPGASGWPLFYSGFLSQNNPAALAPPRSNQYGTATLPIYYEDADGVGRRAMGAYAALPQNYTPNISTITTMPVAGFEGLPEATANQFPTANGYGVGTATYQSQSRPLILNRPFHSVAEMSYASRGGIWKQVDFFTPESGDTGLLDCFCIDDPLPTALAAGKVNLNTRQQPVLKAILAGAYRDEVNNYAPGAPLPYSPSAPLTATEADAAASKVLGITTDTADNWRGPFSFVGDIVGRYIPNPNGTGTDLYTYQATASTGVPNPNPAYSFAGLSAALDNTVYTYPNPNTSSAAADYKIQRMRETAIRPLVDCGQTRVWNILIDLVAQTGNYPASATMLNQFQVTQENHYWLHVALDRFTGQVLDENLEQIFEGVTDLALSAASVPENAAVGTTVGAILPTDANANDTFTYTLVAGTGSDDNASFTLSGNTLQTATTFRYLTQSSYTVRVQAINGYGQSFQKALTISILPGPYTQWKVANFGSSANVAAVAGDGADPDHDGLINLLEYALGTSPVQGGASGVTVSQGNGTLTMYYPRSSTATDASLHAFWTTDLTNPNGWTRTGVTETMLSDDGTTQQWQATVTVSPGQPAFMRLRATQP